MGSVGHRFGRAVGAVTAGLLAFGVAPAAATTLTVNTTSDEMTAADGTCSLREAIVAVNSPAAPTDCQSAGFGANTIVLGAHRYLLTVRSAGELNVAGTVNSLTIAGAGANATVIDATGLGDRVLQISGSATVTIDALAVTGGHAPDGATGTPGADAVTTAAPGGAGGNGASGGGIENDGTLTLNGVAVSGNRAGAGGAGGHGGLGQTGGAGGDAGAPGSGGGILNTGTLTVADSSITDNHGGTGGAGGDAGLGDIALGAPGGAGGSGGSGGGIDNAFGTVTITRTTISANAAGGGGSGGHGGESDGSGVPGGTGGAGSPGGQGGGIIDAGGSVSIINSTVAGNRAGDGGNGGTGGAGPNHGFGGTGGAGGDGNVGGGFYSFGGTDSITNATIVGNAAGAPGGGGGGGVGVNSDGSSGSPGAAGSGDGAYDASATPVMLRNTIVASNGSDNCAGGEIADGGHNLSFPDATCPGLNADPKLGPLQDNGGPVKTVGLGQGSAAVDNGAGCPGTDERGVPRPGGPACDIGAYEVVGPSAGVTPATGVSTSVAVLHGSVVPNAGAAAVHFEFGTTTAYGSATPTVSVGGVGATPVSAAVAGLKPQTTYHFRVVITAPDGSAQSLDSTFQTLKLPAVRPQITKLAIMPRSFAPRRRSTGRRSAVTITYRDSVAAITTFTVTQRMRGVVTGRRCVAPPRHPAKHAKKPRRCTRTVTRGSFTHRDKPGPNTVKWDGTVNRSVLKPGSYTLSVVAAAGGRKSPAVRADFTVRRGSG